MHALDKRGKILQKSVLMFDGIFLFLFLFFLSSLYLQLDILVSAVLTNHELIMSMSSGGMASTLMP